MRLAGSVPGALGTPRNLPKRGVNVESSFACHADHLIRSRGRTSHAQDSIALVEKADRDRVEDLGESIIADLL